MTDMAFNFRSTLAYVTDGAGETFFGGGAYAASPGYGILPGSTANYQNRSTTVDRRLAGTAYAANSAGVYIEFRADIGNGTFDTRLALGNALNAQTSMKIEVFDGADVTPLFSVTGTTSAAAHWFDASGVERTSSADWVSNNAAQSITIANGYVRFKLGNTVGDYSVLSHISFVGTGGGSSIPVFMHHYRQQGIS